MSSNADNALRDRYSRAARLTAPKIAARTPSAVVQGYWVDPASFYFLAERYESSLDRVIGVPSLLDAGTGRVEEVIALAVLSDLLSEDANRVTLEELSCAHIDMPDRCTLAVSFQGKEYFIDRRSNRVIAAKPSLGEPALYSPDGRYGCVVRGHDIGLKERSSGLERSLTTDGGPNLAYGQQSETALSAVSYRRCPAPVGLWSPDSQWFLTHRIDERLLPEVALVQHAPPGGGRPILHRFKYAIPGDPLPIATMVGIHIASGRLVAFTDFPVPIASFSPFSQRRVWFGQGGRAWVIGLDRYCKKAELIHLDLENGVGRVAITERVESGYADLNPSINGTPNVRTLSSSNEVIWFSERDGWGHLYLYDASTGDLKNRITNGRWLVRDIVHVDERERSMLFLAGGIDPTADPAWRSLCAVNLDGSGFKVLSAFPGDVYVPTTEPTGADQSRPFHTQHSHPGVSPDARFAVARFGSSDRGNETKCVNLATQRSFVIASARPGPQDVPPRRLSLPAADGQTRLHGLLCLPSDFDETRRYPLIDYIYPGPQIAWQPQHFRSLRAAFAQSLAELGFVTLMLDTRGTPISNRSFHQIGYGNLLEPQLADHAAVVRELCRQCSFIDGDRIGILGQSGGGAAAVRALCDYGDLFKTGVAVCGNHDSTVYAAVWSDKYRGPGEPQSWTAQANATVAHRLKGKLMLVSGDMDENVTVSQTLSLAEALQKANKDFELLIVPGGGHDILTSNGYVQRRIWDYFVRNLLYQTPPTDVAICFESHELERLAIRAAREAR